MRIQALNSYVRPWRPERPVSVTAGGVKLFHVTLAEKGGETVKRVLALSERGAKDKIFSARLSKNKACRVVSIRQKSFLESDLPFLRTLQNFLGE